MLTAEKHFSLPPEQGEPKVGAEFFSNPKMSNGTFKAARTRDSLIRNVGIMLQLRESRGFAETEQFGAVSEIRDWCPNLEIGGATGRRELTGLLAEAQLCKDAGEVVSRCLND